jgi:hypothetical protein
MPPGVGGDEDAAVGDVEQPVDRLHRDLLAGEVPPDVVAVFEDADPPRVVHPAADGVDVRWGRLRGVGIGIEDLGRDPLQELEGTPRKGLGRSGLASGSVTSMICPERRSSSPSADVDSPLHV